MIINKIFKVSSLAKLTRNLYFLILKPKSDYTWGKLFAMTASESQQPGKLTPAIWPPQDSYFEDKQINFEK